MISEKKIFVSIVNYGMDNKINKLTCVKNRPTLHRIKFPCFISKMGGVSSMAHNETLIFGMGNTLLSDEGAGFMCSSRFNPVILISPRLISSIVVHSDLSTGRNENYCFST